MSASIRQHVRSQFQFSTLGRVVRFLKRRRARVNSHIDAAAGNLPGPAVALIKRVVKRTRLFARERRAVADELIAHFADGLAAGETIEQLIASFGDEKTAAALMRRAKRRARSRWLRATILSTKIVAGLATVYAGIGVYFSTGRANPTVDYLTPINAAALAVPESDRAWPLYRKALLTLAAHGTIRPSDRAFEQAAVDANEVPQYPMYFETLPNHSRWTDLAKWLDEHADTVSLTREAAAKPRLGFVLGPTGSIYDPKLFPLEVSWAATAADRPRDPLNPMSEFTEDRGLWELDSLSKILCAHARLARERDDSAALFADLTAMLQLGMHGRSAVSLRIQREIVIGNWRASIDEVQRTLMHKPTLLTDAQLSDLAHRLSGPELAIDLFDPTGEWHRFMNAVQFTFTDDGKGDGRLTPDGLWAFGGNWGVRPPGGCSATSHAIEVVANWSIAPAAYLASVSRADEVATAEKRFATLILQWSTPVRDRKDYFHSPDTWFDIATRSVMAFRHNVHYPFLDQEGIEGSGELMLASRDAVVVGIALELHRRRAGRYPATLDELVPTLLPAIAPDRITGGPLSYRLIDGKPVVYSFGVDRKDDNGVAPKDYLDRPNPWAAARWDHMDNPPIGDWILYEDPGPYPPEEIPSSADGAADPAAEL